MFQVLPVSESLSLFAREHLPALRWKRQMQLHHMLFAERGGRIVRALRSKETKNVNPDELKNLVTIPIRNPNRKPDAWTEEKERKFQHWRAYGCPGFLRVGLDGAYQELPEEDFSRHVYDHMLRLLEEKLKCFTERLNGFIRHVFAAHPKAIGAVGVITAPKTDDTYLLSRCPLNPAEIIQALGRYPDAGFIGALVMIETNRKPICVPVDGDDPLIAEQMEAALDDITPEMCVCRESRTFS
jgi:hypothetical protein